MWSRVRARPQTGSLKRCGGAAIVRIQASASRPPFRGPGGLSPWQGVQGDSVPRPPEALFARGVVGAQARAGQGQQQGVDNVRSFGLRKKGRMQGTGKSQDAHACEIHDASWLFPVLRQPVFSRRPEKESSPRMGGGNRGEDDPGIWVPGAALLGEARLWSGIASFEGLGGESPAKSATVLAGIGGGEPANYGVGADGGVVASACSRRVVVVLSVVRPWPCRVRSPFHAMSSWPGSP